MVVVVVVDGVVVVDDGTFGTTDVDDDGVLLVVDASGVALISRSSCGGKPFFVSGGTNDAGSVGNAVVMAEPAVVAAVPPFTTIVACGFLSSMTIG